MSNKDGEVMSEGWWERMIENDKPLPSTLRANRVKNKNKMVGEDGKPVLETDKDESCS